MPGYSEIGASGLPERGSIGSSGLTLASNAIGRILADCAMKQQEESPGAGAGSRPRTGLGTLAWFLICKGFYLP